MKHYVYLVKCNDGSLYCGWTTDIHFRVNQHNMGKGAKYTRGRRPVELVFVKLVKNKSYALKEEYRIKQLSRIKKWDLINEKGCLDLI